MTTEKTHSVKLLEPMTIYNALPQKTQLLAELAVVADVAENDVLELDLSQVAEMDTAGLQLLLLVKREASKAGKKVKLTAHSPAISEILEFTHLVRHFGDPMVIPRADRPAPSKNVAFR